MKKYVLSENQYKKLRRSLLEMRLRTYIFDWDDNILYMPTTIKMDKKKGGEWVPVDVPTDEYAHIRTSPEYRLRDNDVVVAFKDFRDSEPFIEDTKKAMNQWLSDKGSLDKSKEKAVKDTIKKFIPSLVKEKNSTLHLSQSLYDDCDDILIVNFKKIRNLVDASVNS